MHRGERLFIFGSSLSSEAKCTLRMRRLLETIVWCYSVPEEPFMRLRGLLHCLLEKASQQASIIVSSRTCLTASTSGTVLQEKHVPNMATAYQLQPA